ncbi:MAG TPA: T9SS type A sorting domain-containing protein, partial [Ferruginibacter sp.]|nr:T9SS type A sorting domain-containing protein [Ferruginibacter sp.]
QLAVSKNTGTTNETINITLAAGTYYVKVLGSNVYSATVCYTLRVNMGVSSRPGMEEIPPVVAPLLFPNPVITTATLIMPDFAGTPEVRIFNMLGQMVMIQPVSSKPKQLDLSNLPAGVYMLKMMNNGEMIGSTKFIKAQKM